MFNNVIKIKVGPTVSTILRANQMVLKELAELCSYQKISEKAKKYSKACQTGWDGKVSVLNKITGQVPTGLVPKIVEWLHNKGYQVELEKALPVTSEHVKMMHLSPLESLRDYQKEAVERIKKFKRGIIQLPTGAGKSEVAVGAALELKRPTIFFVHQKTLLTQAKERFEKYIKDIKIGMIGDSVLDPGLITIASIPTVSSWLIPPKAPDKTKKDTDQSYLEKCAKYDQDLITWGETHERAKNFLAQFNFAVFDECHHLAADTFFTCASYCTGAEYIIALSATAFRDDNADILIEAGSGNVIYSLSLSDVVDMGFLVPAEIHIHDYPPLPPLALSNVYAEQYKLCITLNEGRNDEIINQTEKLSTDGFKTLILCREIEHIDILSQKLEEKGLPHLVIHGKTKNRDVLINQFKEGDVNVLVGSDIFSEGVDIPCLHAVVLAAAGRSKVKSYQRLGRALRLYPGKDKAMIVDFRDEMKPFYYHFLERMKIYNGEKRFVVHNHHVVKPRGVVRKQPIGEKLEEFKFD